ncbi:MAG: hypothetical protein OQJ77_02420, partial [Thiovulaceae bacterium]|nr:hypothetical protein [Sulfurimonadaceae bacterium]
ATIHDYLVYLKHFSKHYQVKNIYVQIDIENILHHTTGGFHRKDHPDVSKENILDFYRVHLLGIYPVGWRKKIKNNFFINSEQSYNLTNGVWYRQTREAQISSDCSEYIKRESTFHKINKRVNGAGKNYEKTIQALKELKNISNVNNINLIVLTTPHNHNMMDSYKLDAYLKFLYDISQITDFYDFSGYNTITTNDCNYYEESHYRPFIGKIIAARIFNDKSIEIPNDFGVFVTKDNINEHLKYKKLEVFNHDNKKFN